MHQFQWSPCTEGNGAPAWSCDGRDYSPDVFGGWTAQHDFWAGAVAPDARPLLDHFLDVWRVVAHHYRRNRTVVGYELLNEPLDILAPATFEAISLYPAYRRWAAIVRGEGAPTDVGPRAAGHPEHRHRRKARADRRREPAVRAAPLHGDVRPAGPQVRRRSAPRSTPTTSSRHPRGRPKARSYG
jgi:hypothetical protein